MERSVFVFQLEQALPQNREQFNFPGSHLPHMFNWEEREAGGRDSEEMDLIFNEI